jgi:hypothetical protein
MLLNAARGGGRPVDPPLLEWAVGIEAAEAAAAEAATDVETLSQDELMRRAREELTAAAQLLRLEAAVKARTGPAAAVAGAAANDPAAAKSRAAAAATGRPTPVRVLFQKSRAPRPAPPRSAFQTLKAQRAKARE